MVPDVGRKRAWEGLHLFFYPTGVKGKSWPIDSCKEIAKMVPEPILVEGEVETNANPVKKPGSIPILVVDDEPINQQVLKNHLSGQGFDLTQAMNGEEAIRIPEEVFNASTRCCWIL